MSDNAKPGGAIWKTGIHQVSLQGQPVRLAAPQYSLIQNYNLMKRKIRENGHIPIGVDHIPESVLASNPVLKKLLDEKDINPYDVGMIKEVSTDGESIRIKDAQFTNQSVQDLFDKGELTAWSVVQDIKASKCPTDKADVVADYFSDIERVDLVGRGGCETCFVEGGGVPDGYERINASFMEVDTLTEDPKVKKEPEVIKDPVKADPVKTEPVKTDPVVEDPKAKDDPKVDPEPAKDPIEVLQGQVASLTDTVGTLATTVTGIVDGTIEAKLPESIETKLKEVDNLKIEASKAKVGTLIDGKIQAGFVTPAMKEGLLKAGLAMEEKDFLELLAGYKEKLWDGKLHAGNPNPDDPEEPKTLSMDDMKAARKQGRF